MAAKRTVDVKCDGYAFEEENAQRKVLPCGATLRVGSRDIFMPNPKIYKFCVTKCPLCGSLTYVDLSCFCEETRGFVENRTEEDVDNDPFRNQEEND